MRSPLGIFRRGGDEGFAMLTVIASIFVLSLLVLASLGYAMNSLPQARKSQDHHAALAAAQAGVDDYIRRLVQNDTYWQNGGVDAANPAFTAAGATIPGTSSPARFTYQPLSSVADISLGRVIRLKSTGILNGTKRSITVSLGKRSFLEFLYFTDKETTDPAAYPNIWQPTMSEPTATTLCNRYHYASPPRDPSCVDVTFGNDTFDGPVHTNDAMYINTSSGQLNFADPIVESSWPNPPDPNNRFRVVQAGMQPTGNKPKYADVIPLPMSNSELKTTAQTSTSGCVFTGATRIKFNANGSLTIRSPYTRVSNPCFTASPTVNFAPQTVTPPPNTVIYVDQVVSDPTACPTGDFKTVLQTWPQDDDDSQIQGRTKYDCWAGDAFVEGDVRGRYTIGTKGNIVITGDLRYVDRSSSDVLGLIADNQVQVYHPVFCDARRGGKDRGDCRKPYTNPAPVRPVGESNTADLTNVQIDAAIMSVQHTFTVQNYDVGPSLNTLGVYGAIVQNFRGAVGRPAYGTFVRSGYLKSYSYDRSLRAAPPPSFLDPGQSAWRVVSFSEQKP